MHHDHQHVRYLWLLLVLGVQLLSRPKSQVLGENTKIGMDEISIFDQFIQQYKFQVI